jgi:hypothetical protein
MQDPQAESAVRSVAFLAQAMRTIKKKMRGDLRSSPFDDYVEFGGSSTSPIEPSCTTPAGGFALRHNLCSLDPFTL